MIAPIIEGADGVTLTSTGLVAVREHADFVDQVLAGRATDRARAFRLVMTLNHEAIHFVQCFTASFPYSFSLSLLELSSQLMAVSRSNRLDREVVGQFRSAFRSRVNQYRSPCRNLTTIDLLEAMAVTEGYRATAVAAQNNSNAFHAFLQESFPDPESEYRRAIGIVTTKLGIAAGYELTPRLCYLALNGDSPARNFWYFVDSLASNRSTTATSLSAVELLRRFGMDIESSLLHVIEAGLPAESTHPIFQPFLKALLEIGDLSDRYEFAAKPGGWMGGGGPPAVGNLVPPLVVCSGGRGRIMGLASAWSKEDTFLYLDSTALIGACLTLLSGRRYSQTCVHEQCPVHRSALCHSWFAKPHEISWSQCVFPERVRVQFGRDFQDVLTLCH